MKPRDLASRVRAAVAPTIWQRRWAVVWNAGGDLRTEADWLAYHLPRLGYGVVCVKVADGRRRYTGDKGLNLSHEWLEPLRRAGLRITGWAYSYGYDAELEATLAAELCRELRLQAYVVDCEKEYEYDPVNEPAAGAGRERYRYAAEWLKAWHAQPKRPPLGVTSFGRVDLHRLDWAAFAKAGARFVPQAYANESAELLPALCVEHAGLYFDRRFVHPWVGCYAAPGGHVTGAEYAAELKAAGTRGFGVYLADTAQLGDLTELGRAR